MKQREEIPYWSYNKVLMMMLYILSILLWPWWGPKRLWKRIRTGKQDCQCKLCKDYQALELARRHGRKVQEPLAYEMAIIWNSRSPWSHHSMFWFLEYEPGDYTKGLKRIGPIDEDGELIDQDGLLKRIWDWLFSWKFWGKK